MFAAACDHSSVTEQPQCGTAGISETNCLQLGCCYRDGLCYYSPAATYIQYTNMVPEGQGDGFLTLEQYSAQGCAYECDLG